jgi:hypothetical protein
MAEVRKMPPGQAKNTMESSLLVILLLGNKRKNTDINSIDSRESNPLSILGAVNFR